jgi:hypothetical protein
MIYTHSCGHPLWMEQKHVGGGGDVPWYWNQRPIQHDSIKSCPSCKAALPGSLTDHIRAVDDKTLVASGGVN